MKRFLILTALVLLPVLACSQQRVDSPQTVAWDGESSSYEIAVQMLSEDIIILGETTTMEYLIDLQAIGIYGLYTVLVRAVEFTEPDMYDYSDWIRSDSDDDVIMIDGVAQTFMIESRQLAVKPTMLRLR